jgi:hypothetical protein
VIFGQMSLLHLPQRPMILSWSASSDVVAFCLMQVDWNDSS